MSAGKRSETATMALILLIFYLLFCSIYAKDPLFAKNHHYTWYHEIHVTKHIYMAKTNNNRSQSVERDLWPQLPVRPIQFEASGHISFYLNYTCFFTIVHFNYLASEGAFQFDFSVYVIGYIRRSLTV